MLKLKKGLLVSGFWQVQICETDKYKTAFTTPFGHYEWNVMPFVFRMPPVNSRTLWIISSIPSVISPLFILMMSLSISIPLMNIGNIYINVLISSNIVVLLSLQKKKNLNYFKQRFVSLADISEGQIVPLIEPFNLLINFLMSLLIKRSYKDSLGF